MDVRASYSYADLGPRNCAWYATRCAAWMQTRR